jgi:hypothetical protein
LLFPNYFTSDNVSYQYYQQRKEVAHTDVLVVLELIRTAAEDSARTTSRALSKMPAKEVLSGAH